MMNAQFGVLAALVSFLSVLVAVVIRGQEARLSRMELRQDRLESTVAEMGRVQTRLHLSFESLRLLGLDLVRLFRANFPGTAPEPPQLTQMEAWPSADAIIASAQSQGAGPLERRSSP